MQQTCMDRDPTTSLVGSEGAVIYCFLIFGWEEPDNVVMRLSKKSLMRSIMTGI